MVFFTLPPEYTKPPVGQRLKNSFFKWSKRFLLAVFLGAGSLWAISHTPIFSVASNKLLNNNDVNLVPLISGQYATLNNNFSMAINNLTLALKEKNLTDQEKRNINKQLFILYIKAGEFTAAGKLIPSLEETAADDGNENGDAPIFKNLMALFTTIDQINNNRWEHNLLSDQQRAGLGPLSVAIITAWGEMSRKNDSKALTMLENARAENKQDAELLTQIALMKVIMKQPLEPADLVGGNKKINPKNLSIGQTRLYLQSLAQEKKWDEATSLLDAMSQPLPLLLIDDQEKIKSQTALIPLTDSANGGLSYFLLDLAASLLGGNPNSALLFCQLARFANDKNHDAHFMLATIYANLGLTEQSFAILKDLKKEKTYMHLANLAEVDLLKSVGATDDAKGKLTDLNAKYPEVIEYPLALGVLNAEKRDFKAAEKSFSTVIDINKKYPANQNAWFYYYQYGVALTEQNKWALAENNFLTALKINPNAPEVLNFLGYSWIERKKNIGESIVMLKKANALAPNNGAILDSLGWAYYNLGKYELARGYLEKAGQLVASDPDINSHLGDVYWQLNEKTTAKLFWQKSLEKTSDETGRLHLQRKISSGL